MGIGVLKTLVGKTLNKREGWKSNNWPIIKSGYSVLGCLF